MSPEATLCFNSAGVSAYSQMWSIHLGAVIDRVSLQAISAGIIAQDSNQEVTQQGENSITSEK